MARRVNEFVIRKIVKRELQQSYTVAEKAVVSAITAAVLENTDKTAVKSIVQVLSSFYPGSDVIPITARRIHSEIYDS